MNERDPQADLNKIQNYRRDWLRTKTPEDSLRILEEWNNLESDVPTENLGGLTMLWGLVVALIIGYVLNSVRIETLEERLSTISKEVPESEGN